eukprot:2297175-Alexandrium_andersonii.AAC.1
MPVSPCWLPVPPAAAACAGRTSSATSRVMPGLTSGAATRGLARSSGSDRTLAPPSSLSVSAGRTGLSSAPGT